MESVLMNIPLIFKKETIYILMEYVIPLGKMLFKVISSCTLSYISGKVSVRKLFIQPSNSVTYHIMNISKSKWNGHHIATIYCQEEENTKRPRNALTWVEIWDLTTEIQCNKFM